MPRQTNEVAANTKTRPDFIAASIEVSPGQVLKGEVEAGLFPPNTRTYLHDLGRHTHQELARAARMIRDAGYSPVQHIAARRLTGTQALASHIKRLVNEGGLDDVLVIAGESERQMGPYSSTMDVLRSQILDRHGIRHIGVAGHPEGNPAAPRGTEQASLQEKAAFQRESDAALRIVTQFGFDGTGFAHWAIGLREAGIDLPVHIGVAGPASMATLLRFAALSGVGHSLSFLKSRSRALTSLLSTPSPESVVGPIEAAWRVNPHGPIAQIHVFAFGGLKKSSEWLAQRRSLDIKICLYDHKNENP